MRRSKAQTLQNIFFLDSTWSGRESICVSVDDGEGLADGRLLLTGRSPSSSPQSTEWRLEVVRRSHHASAGQCTASPGGGQDIFRPSVRLPTTETRHDEVAALCALHHRSPTVGLSTPRGPRCVTASGWRLSSVRRVSQPGWRDPVPRPLCLMACLESCRRGEPGHGHGEI